MSNGKDPYAVLGIRRGASEEQVRDAYRELVKKYHPDHYQDHPLAELAKEKMQEINEAYDSLTSGNQQRNDGSQQNQQNQGNYNPWQRTTYSGGGNPFGQTFYGSKNNSSCCSDLACLCCADSCCECMGGDLCICC